MTNHPLFQFVPKPHSPSLSLSLMQYCLFYFFFLTAFTSYHSSWMIKTPHFKFYLTSLLLMFLLLLCSFVRFVLSSSLYILSTEHFSHTCTLSNWPSTFGSQWCFSTNKINPYRSHMTFKYLYVAFFFIWLFSHVIFHMINLGSCDSFMNSFMNN